MNKNIDLTETLKGLEGTQIYCLLTGEYVTFIKIIPNSGSPIQIRDKRGEYWYYPKEGYKYSDYPHGECMLVPAQDQWDWSKFKRLIPVNTPMMCSDGKTTWHLKYYSGFYEGFHRVHSRNYKDNFEQWRYVIPYNQFDPNNIEGSLKYNIQKGNEE